MEMSPGGRIAYASADIYTRAAQIMAQEHRASVDVTGWGCSCGKGASGLQANRPGTWRAARTRHQRSEMAKIIARLESDR